MSLYKTNPDLGGYVHADAVETDRKLREGDGLVWPGDPSLWLSMGILTAKFTGYNKMCKRHVTKGEVIARRYEVWRHNELGVDVMLGYWLLEEFDRIIPDLAGLRLDSPAHVDTGTKVDAVNEKVEAAAGREYAEHMGEAAEHLGKLMHDRTQPRNVFRGMPGSRDDAKPEIKVTDKRASANATSD